MINHSGRFTVVAQDNRRVLMNEHANFSNLTTAAIVSKHRVTADVNVTSGASQGYAAIGKNDKLILDDFLAGDKNRYYEDLYYHDAVAGGAVDMFSLMPFSEFSLIGIKDRKIIDTYLKTVENLRCDILMPMISRDYLVNGRFVGSLNYDPAEEAYTGIVPHSSSNCVFTEIELFNQDPLIDLKIPKSLNQLLQKNDPRLQNILSKIPEIMRQSGTIPLKPEATMFVPRLTLSKDTIGTSYYERILPYYIMERALFRGSIEMSQRRLKSTLHVTAGDGEWVPGQGELEALRDLWMQAEVDPSGAVIATRNGVSTNEVRNGSDFWRYSEDVDFLSTGKYKALGITETFINGEGNFNAVDQTLSVMVENLRNHRDTLTRRVFYEKIFPQIALANGFTNEHRITASSEESNSYVVSRNKRLIVLGNVQYDGRNLQMPKIKYHKSLRPEGDSAYIDMLNNLNEKGVPISIAMLAAAGGVNLDDLIASFDEDLATRKKIAAYTKKIAAFMPKQDTDNNAEAQAIAKMLVPKGKSLSALARDYKDDVLPFATDDKGRRRHTSLKDRKRRKDRIVKHSATALANLARIENRV